MTIYLRLTGLGGGGRKRHMKSEHPRLKLGKRASFVKTHLKRLPQVKETWEADFRALPRPPEQPDTLAEAMAALEKGLKKWFDEQGIDLG